MLVLERKQTAGTYQGQTEGKTVAGEKTANASDLGEPGVPYQTPGNDTDRSHDTRGTDDGNESGPGGPVSNESVSGQNEDDLPF
jgi:hypothetical protein